MRVDVRENGARDVGGRYHQDQHGSAIREMILRNVKLIVQEDHVSAFRADGFERYSGDFFVLRLRA